MALDVTALSNRGFLINGKWLNSGKPVEVRSPLDQSVVSTVMFASPADLDAAISAAVEAFEKTRRMQSYERQAILEKIANAIKERREEFARALVLEAGKPIVTARGEVDRAIFTFRVAAEEATRIGGEFLPLDTLQASAGRWGLVRRFPLGPIAAISPFNFPLNLVAHKVAPAIAAGCSVVLKPASQTPTAALMLGEIVLEAGWPAGGLNVLPMSNQDSAQLVSDDRLKLLTFTGSSAVGWQLKAKSGKKKVTLELGGNAGLIIHSDADFDYAAERCATVGYGYAGQSCISVQRIFVHRPVLDRFTDAFVERVKELKFGDPMEESTVVGPLIRPSDVKRAAEWVDEAVKGGAKLLCGGKVHGNVMEPTVLTRTTPEMKVNCDEVFAPVKTVEPYDDFDEAIRRVNDSPYGLQAGVFVNDLRLLFRAYEELEVGGVVAGDVPTFRIDNMPYGGVKDSGMGREGLRYAIEEMTEPKLLVVNQR